MSTQQSDHEQGLAIINIIADLLAKTQATWTEHLERQKLLKFLIARLEKLNTLENSVPEEVPVAGQS